MNNHGEVQAPLNNYCSPEQGVTGTKPWLNNDLRKYKPVVAHRKQLLPAAVIRLRKETLKNGVSQTVK